MYFCKNLSIHIFNAVSIDVSVILERNVRSPLGLKYTCSHQALAKGHLRIHIARDMSANLAQNDHCTDSSVRYKLTLAILVYTCRRDRPSVAYTAAYVVCYTSLACLSSDTFLKHKAI